MYNVRFSIIFFFQMILTDQVPRLLGRALSTTGGYPTPQPIISMYLGQIGHQVLLSFVKRKKPVYCYTNHAQRWRYSQCTEKKSFRTEYLDALNEENLFKLYFYFSKIHRSNKKQYFITTISKFCRISNFHVVVSPHYRSVSSIATATEEILHRLIWIFSLDDTQRSCKMRL